MTNLLKQKIKQIIAATGPLTIAEYMHLCHADPEHGYYASTNPVGKKGDFITAPEISQMFGELIAVWCMQTWQNIGSPNPVQIAELGPGRGTLMHDFLRAAKSNPQFSKAIKIKLVETSPSLTKEQKTTLAADADNIEWLTTIDQLNPLPTIFIANEFLDALPFRQFVKTKGSWLEHCIGIDENNELSFVLSPTGIDLQRLPPGHETQPEGTIFETAPPREAITANVADHIKTNSGAALFIDYGHKTSAFG
ncbi:MAG: SAM-dependent methyltransferase, partial [Rhizobiaceae bacterium]|nr:SAM-dependent methyltransferase [Rhizobiaceae bacterium]